MIVYTYHIILSQQIFTASSYSSAHYDCQQTEIDIKEGKKSMLPYFQNNVWNNTTHILPISQRFQYKNQEWWFC